jgi:hypothetical protein
VRSGPEIMTILRGVIVCVYQEYCNAKACVETKQCASLWTG